MSEPVLNYMDTSAADHGRKPPMRFLPLDFVVVVISIIIIKNIIKSRLLDAF